MSSWPRRLFLTALVLMVASCTVVYMTETTVVGIDLLKSEQIYSNELRFK